MLNEPVESLATRIIQEIRQIVTQPPFYLAFSGGMDSTVVACLAMDALGKKNVQLVHLLFGPYTYLKTLENVLRSADRFGLPLRLIDKQKEQEHYLRYGPSCNLCTRKIKLGSLEEYVQSENGFWVGSGANRSDTWGQYGLKVLGHSYSPLFDLDKKEISELLKYYGLTSEMVRAGESRHREGCKLKHLMKGLVAPNFHGYAVSLANEVLLDVLRNERIEAETANVKIIGALSQNIALVNVYPHPSKQIQENILSLLSSIPEIQKSYFVDTPLTLTIKANPGIFRSPYSRGWLEKGKIQPEFSATVNFLWQESPNRNLRTYQVVDMKFEGDAIGHEV